MRFSLCSLLLFVVLSCSKSKNKRKELIDFVPHNSEAILKISNLESFKSTIENNTFLSAFSEGNTYKSLNLKSGAVSILNANSEVLLCLSKLENDSLQYTLITPYSKTLFQTDSFKNYVEEQLKYKSYSITKSTLEEAISFHTVIDSTFILSSSKTIITDILSSSVKTSALKKFNDATGTDANLSAILKTKDTLAPSFFIENELKSNALCDIIAFDTEIIQDDIYINGIVKSLDSSKKVIDIFKNTVPQENQMHQITPGNSDGYLSFTFDDFAVLHDNILNHNDNDSIPKNEELFNSATEIGVIYEGENRAVVLNSIDAIATRDALLSEQNKIDSYRTIAIFEFSQSTIFSETFTPLLQNIDTSKYCVIDNFFVFAESMELLQNIIANYQNKTTFGQLYQFKALSEHLSNESSIMFAAKPEFFASNLTTTNTSSLKPYGIYGVQLVYDTDFAHIHSVLIKGKKRRAQHSISESFNININTELLTSPQFVTNHITKQKEIVVQDINNNLYLISNKGKILWKKQLKGAILGKVEQIDIYKNGRLQLVFATSNYLYVIDRKGRDVAPFPLKFNDEITQPLSVFDYDKNKKYRLMVIQGSTILMYDARGKIVSGFTFKKANGTIISQPKHFRIGTKDYLVLKTKNKLYILDRTGKTRVSPKSQNTFSNESVFLHKNKFTTTSSDGKLISIDNRGNVAAVNLNLTEDHNLETTSKTRVTFRDNKLGIKSKVLELDYGNYTRPNIFYINDKIYVTITDLQAKKVYLYDSQGKLLPNFPVYGNSPIALDNIDSDRNLEFVTKGDANTLILYQIN